MRKLALILPTVLAALALGACQSSQAAEDPLPSGDRPLTVRDVARMESEYASERNWSKLRRTVDGRTNALNRDLDSVWSTFNRYLFNYSASDPYVNFETDETYLTVLWSQTVDGVAQNVVPFVPFGGSAIR